MLTTLLNPFRLASFAVMARWRMLGIAVKQWSGTQWGIFLTVVSAFTAIIATIGATPKTGIHPTLHLSLGKPSAIFDGKEEATDVMMERILDALEYSVAYSQSRAFPSPKYYNNEALKGGEETKKQKLAVIEKGTMRFPLNLSVDNRSGEKISLETIHVFFGYWDGAETPQFVGTECHFASIVCDDLDHATIASNYPMEVQLGSPIFTWLLLEHVANVAKKDGQINWQVLISMLFQLNPSLMTHVGKLDQVIRLLEDGKTPFVTIARGEGKRGEIVLSIVECKLKSETSEENEARYFFSSLANVRFGDAFVAIAYSTLAVAVIAGVSMVRKTNKKFTRKAFCLILLFFSVNLLLLTLGIFLQVGFEAWAYSVEKQYFGQWISSDFKDAFIHMLPSAVIPCGLISCAFLSGKVPGVRIWRCALWSFSVLTIFDSIIAIFGPTKESLQSICVSLVCNFFGGIILSLVCSLVGEWIFKEGKDEFFDNGIPA